MLFLLYSPDNGACLFPVIAQNLCPVQMIGGFASAADPIAVYQRAITTANTSATITTCTVKTAATIIQNPDAMKPVALYGVK